VLDTRELLARRMRAEQRAHLAREVIETVLLTGLIFLVVHFAVGTFQVYGPSMQPGLHSDQRLLVNQLAYLFGQPGRGDVVIVHHIGPLCGQQTPSGGLDLVKRVIAVPGDTIAINTTQVIVDGVVLNEPYVDAPPDAARNAIVLPPEKLGSDQFYVMGDNRLDSCDSRDSTVGPIPRANIIGRVVMIFWPFNEVQWLPNYSSVFAAVKQH
jgi:signal peptidase I